MTKSRTAAIFGVICWFVGGAAIAQSVNFPLTDDSDASPLVIEADDGLEWIPKEGRYIARGNARASRGTVTLRADQLIAHYRETKKGGSGQEMIRLDATGHVKITSVNKDAKGRKATTTATGDIAVYHVKESVFVLNGKRLRLVSPQGVLTARDSLEYWDKRQTAVARGKAVVSQGKQRLHADILTAYIAQSPAPKKPGAKPPLGGAGQKINRVDAFGNVHVSVPNAIIRGDKGEFYPATSIAKLHGNVKITSNKNQLNGDEAQVNLKTGIYRLLGKRVKGLLTPNRTR
jgi:lipopolysaccharide export system protein LptA